MKTIEGGLTVGEFFDALEKTVKKIDEIKKTENEISKITNKLKKEIKMTDVLTTDERAHDRVTPKRDKERKKYELRLDYRLESKGRKENVIIVFNTLDEVQKHLNGLQNVVSFDIYKSRGGFYEDTNWAE